MSSILSLCPVITAGGDVSLSELGGRDTALLPHITRVNYIAMLDKSHIDKSHNTYTSYNTN